MKILKNNLGKIICVLGTQWGDEGKGKLVDILAKEYDIIARFSGGANAGHTIYINDPDTGKQIKFIAHLLPLGMFHSDKICLIGNGLVLHLPTLLDEINLLREHNIEIMDRLVISERAHLIFDYHLLADEAQEKIKKGQKIGTTKRGIGPAYRDKIDRIGIRACELRNPNTLAHKIRVNAEALIDIYKIEFDIEKEIVKAGDLADLFAPLVQDSVDFLHEELKKGKSVLLEGAQGTMLDIDHGTYPYVTSSSTTIGGMITGLGLPPKLVDSVIGIAKAYTTRVGSGPFPTELGTLEDEMLREKGQEYGATTGRPRRCGWFDANVVRYSAKLNGLTSLNVTKLDVLSGFETLKIGYKYIIDGNEVKGMPALLEDYDKLEVEYLEMPGWDEDISKIRKFSDLPKNARNYLKTIEELVEVPVQFIGVGINREDMIIRF